MPFIKMVTSNVLYSRPTTHDTLVVKQFNTQWKHTQPTPTVLRVRHAHLQRSTLTSQAHVQVWKIYCTKIVTDAFWAHVKTVAQRSNIPGGNCKRRWHGTSRSCTLGDDDKSTNFCTVSKCSLCNIIKVGDHMSPRSRTLTTCDVVSKDVFQARQSRLSDSVRPLRQGHLHLRDF